MNLTVNVASRLAHFAATDPDRAAVIVARTGKQFTFRELHADSDALAHGLVAAGITRGTRVAVMVPPSLEFFSLVFALFKVAAVPVMIDPGMGVKNLGKCLAEAEPQAFIGIPKAHLGRRLYGWAKGAITVNVGRWKFFCDHSTQSLRNFDGTSGPFPSPDVTADEMAAILFTSGSTGPAKGVVYTHGIFNAQVDMLKQVYGIEPGEVDLCTFALFALFGPALGMTCIVPTMDFSRPATADAKLITSTITKYRVTNFFCSPAIIGNLAWKGKRLPSLKRAISAGAPAVPNVVRSFARLLGVARSFGENDIGVTKIKGNETQLYTPYGATEALPIANIGSDELMNTKSLTETGHGICIGRPVPGVVVHVIPINDGPLPIFNPSQCLPKGEIGELVVRGSVVTQCYWKRDEATHLAKMHDPTTGETLHRMGDVGYYDENGRLWYCGRKNHRVETKNGTLFTEQIEPIFNAARPFFRTALVGLKQGECYEPVIVCEARKEINPAEYLRTNPRKHPKTKHIQTFLLYNGLGFPVDPRHNAKINREALALWAAEQLRKKNA